MGFSVKFDGKGVVAFMRQLSRAGVALDQAAADMATEGLRLADEGYGQRQDPYGRGWRPRVRGGSWPLLEKTGRLRASLRGVPLGRRGFKLVFGTGYGQFHQTGTSRMVRRAILPDRGLPAKWRARIAKVVQQRVAAALGKKGRR